MNGLKDEIKVEVRLFKPSNLVDLMMTSKMVEDKILVLSKGKGPWEHKNVTTSKFNWMTSIFKGGNPATGGYRERKRRSRKGSQGDGQKPRATTK